MKRLALFAFGLQCIASAAGCCGHDWFGSRYGSTAPLYTQPVPAAVQAPPPVYTAPVVQQQPCCPCTPAPPCQ